MFTVKALAGLRCPPAERDIHVYDAKAPRLAYRVTCKGSRAFYWIGRANGRAQRVRIGGAEATIEQARNKAHEFNGGVVKGIDPSAEKRSIRRSATLQEVWDKWDSDHAQLRLRERTRATDKSRFDTCFAEWKTRKLLSIRETDVQSLHAKLGKERGHVTANRAVQLLRKLCNFARLDHNPAAKAVEMFREHERERFVQPDEMPRLFIALDADETNPLIRDFLYLCLWTGARRSNVASMRDEELDIEAAHWTIPADKTKAGKAIVVPLAPEAVKIIERRMGHESGYILPSYGKCGHLVEPKTTWKDVLTRAGLSDLRIHDLRRSLGSYQAALGSSLPVIGASLGHNNPAATKIYARLHLDPVRQSVNAATAAMLGTVELAKVRAEKAEKRK